MKKLILLLSIFLTISTTAQVFDLTKYKPISNTYYFEADTLWTSNRIDLPDNTILSPASGAIYIRYIGGRNFIINMGKNCTISGLDISAARGGVAIAAVGCGNSNSLIENCHIHDTQWGVRMVGDSTSYHAYSNYWLTIRGCTINNTEDDGIFGQYMRNYLIEDNIIYDVNNQYFSGKGGGDGIQIAYYQDTVIIRGNYIDHSKFGNKFCIIVGMTKWNGKGYCLIDHNVLIGRSYQDRMLEDATTHLVVPNNICYLKPMSKYIIKNNALMNGSNGIFEQGGENKVYLDCYNNWFYNNLESFPLNGAWSNYIHNNTFQNGIQNYLSISATGDNITKNIFYTNHGLSITHYYNNKPTEWSALIDPIIEPMGWGCSPIIKRNIHAKSEDSIIYDTIQVPVDSIVLITKDTLIYNYQTIEYYKKVEILHYSIDSIMNEKINSYFDKFKLKIE